MGDKALEIDGKEFVFMAASMLQPLLQALPWLQAERALQSG